MPEELSIKHLFRSVPVDVTFPETQAGLRWRHFGSVAKRNKDGTSPAAPASLHSGGAHSCAACMSSFVWSIKQQDSKTRAPVLLTRALEKSLLLVTSQLHVQEKNAAAHACFNVEPSGNSPVGVMIVHDTKMIPQENVETMIQWKRQFN